MAKLYGEIASSALMTFDKSFARANGQPLDSTEVYYSYESAKEYASGAGAYIGQKIVVIENGVITHYSIEDTIGTLKELGAKPIGDGLTITILDDGKISLANIPEVEKDESGNDIPATYNAVLVNGELTWVKPSTTTVEGLSDLITALTGRVDKTETDITTLKNNVGSASKPESTEGAGDAVEATGLYKTIEDESKRAKEVEKTLGERIDNIDFIDETELENILVDYATIDYVDEKFDSIEIPVVGVDSNDKILTLNSDKLISATVSMSYDEESKAIKLYGKNNKELGSVDATPFIKDGMLDNVEYDEDSNTLTFTWNTESGKKTDTVELSDIIEPYTSGKGLKLEGNEFSIKVADGNESFLSVDENGIKLSGIQAAINTAKSEAITDAEGKIATAKSEAATDATTKANQALTDAKADAANLYATKTYVGTIPSDEKYADITNVVSYVNKKAEEVLSQATGGSSESAASVKAQLDTYKAENDPKVAKNTEDIFTINSKLADIEANADVNIIESVKVNGTELIPDENKAVDISVPTKFSEITDDSGFDSRITAAQTHADKGVTDASNAQITANEAKGIAEGNTTIINEVNAVVSGHTTSINDHLSRIVLLENANTSHQTEYQTLNNIVSGHTSDIAKKASQTDLETAIGRIAGNESKIQVINETTIPAMNAEIEKKANASNVFTKDEITAITGEIAEGKTLVQMISEAKSEATYDDTQVKNDIKANTDAIAILNGDDTIVGSVDYKVAQEVAKILNDDDSDIDTLNEIAAWIISDTTGAAKMNADIVKNASAINKLNGSVDTEGSVLSMIAANAPSLATVQTAGLVKSVANTVENGVFVAKDGTMSVNSINVNKLVQTEGEFLVLNGGSAN